MTRALAAAAFAASVGILVACGDSGDSTDTSSEAASDGRGDERVSGDPFGAMGGSTSSSGGSSGSTTSSSGSTSSGGSSTSSGSSSSSGGTSASSASSSTGGTSASSASSSTGGTSASSTSSSSGGTSASSASSTGGASSSASSSGGASSSSGGIGACSVTLSGGGGGDPGGVIPVCCAPSTTEKAAINELFALLNAYRAEQGKAALIYDTKLEAAVQGHCIHMGTHDFWGHIAPESSVSAPDKRAQLCGSDATAENLANGQPTAAAVMAGWKSSSGHNSNLLGPWKRVGLCRSKGYWGQLFD